jgi:hypothetical protein
MKEVAQPVPGESEVLVPLSDGAGEVIALRPGVTRFHLGDRVAGTFFEHWVDGRRTAESNATARGGAIDGMLSEMVVSHEDGLVLIPDHLTPEPDLENAVEMQHSMYHALLQIIGSPGGNSRIRKELAALGQQLSWNTDIDYREFFENGNEFLKEAVLQLYREAGLDLEEELARVNAFTRVSASSYALDWWNTPGRTAKGTPQIPILRLHETGDRNVPPSLAQGYDNLVRESGRGDLYRTAYVRSPSHCGFTPAETMAAVETLERRLDEGVWGSTDPEQMNSLAQSLDPSPARFTHIDRYAQKKYNRAWAPPAWGGSRSP